MSDLEYFLNLKRNQVKMLQNRSYNVADELWMFDSSISGSQFKKRLIKKYGEYPIRQLMFSEYEKKGQQNMVVFYVGLEGSKQIKIDAVRKFIDKISEEQKDGIIIVNEDLSTATKQQLENITESQYQIFHEDELLLDIVNHHYQPTYHLISSDEAAKIKFVLGVKGKGLSYILATDPVAKYYHFQLGNMIKIQTSYDINMLVINNIEYAIVV